MRKRLYAGLVVVLLHCAAAAQPAARGEMFISGRVIDEEGRPAAGALVYAHYEGGLRGKLPSAHSDAVGNFRIAVRQAGDYTVGALKSAERRVSPFIPFYNPAGESLVRVSVAEGAPTPFASVQLRPRAGTLALLVEDAATGRPVADFQLMLCLTEEPKYCHAVKAVGRAGGRQQVNAPPSPFTLRVSSDGYDDWDGDGGPAAPPATFQIASGETRQLKVELGRAAGGGAAARLAAPRQMLPADGAEFDHYPRTTRLEWAAVPGAASYTVELEFCLPGKPDPRECRDPHYFQSRKNPPLSGIEGTSYEFNFLGAQPGRWRVWAVDAAGRPGSKSAWARFVYTR